MSNHLRLAAHLALRAMFESDPVRVRSRHLEGTEPEREVREAEGVVQSLFGYGVDELRELADAKPQDRDQYDSKDPIDPRAIGEDITFALTEGAKPGGAEGYTLDRSFPAFEETIAARRRVRAGQRAPIAGAPISHHIAPYEDSDPAFRDFMAEVLKPKP